MLRTAAIFDSRSVRAADTVAAASRGYDAGRRVIGRKRHIAVDSNGWLLAVPVTVAGIQDRDDGCLGLKSASRSTGALTTPRWADDPRPPTPFSS